MFGLDVIQKLNNEWYEKSKLTKQEKKQYSVSFTLSELDIEKLLLVEELLEDLCYQYPEIWAAYVIVEDINKKIEQL